MFRLSEVSQGLGCDAVGHGGWRVTACKLPGHWQCGHGGPGASERPCGGQDCVSHQDPLLKAAPFQHSTAGITWDRSQGLSLLSSSWVGGTAE